jgi:hypothetical protein
MLVDSQLVPARLWLSVLKQKKQSGVVRGISAIEHPAMVLLLGSSVLTQRTTDGTPVLNYPHFLFITILPNLVK